MPQQEDYIIEDDDDKSEEEIQINEKVELSEDEFQFDFTEPQICVCVGKPKRGKSNATKWFILKNTIHNKVFKYGIVFTKTSFNDDYNYIPDEYVYSEYDPAVLTQFIEGVSSLEEKEPCFCIFDDQQGALNRNDPTLVNFISIHRHLKCSIFFNFQYLYGAMPVLRCCSTIALMFNAKGRRTIEGLFENFGQLFDSYEEFKENFLKTTSEKYVAMLYLQDIDEIENNYKWFRSPNMNTKRFNKIKLDY